MKKLLKCLDGTMVNIDSIETIHIDKVADGVFRVFIDTSNSVYTVGEFKREDYAKIFVDRIAKEFVNDIVYLEDLIEDLDEEKKEGN